MVRMGPYLAVLLTVEASGWPGYAETNLRPTKPEWMDWKHPHAKQASQTGDTIRTELSCVLEGFLKGEGSLWLMCRYREKVKMSEVGQGSLENT